MLKIYGDKMRFKVVGPELVFTETLPYEQWHIIQVKGRRQRQILTIKGDNNNPNWLSEDVAPLVAGDICSFLNEKYIDKNINEEWGKINKEARIKYHEEQIRLLKSGKYSWNRHGNGVI